MAININIEELIPALENSGRKIKKSPTKVFIQCPFHADEDPSLMINIDRSSSFPLGSFKCLGCGKHGYLKELLDALKLGIQISDLETTAFTVRPKTIVKQNTTEFELSDDKLYRGIPGKLLKTFGSKLIFTREQYVTLPVNMFGSTLTKIGMNLNPNSSLSTYSVEYGFDNTECMLLYDEAKKLQKETGYPVALVEGPRDAIGMYMNGLPAVALLGAQNWNMTLLLNYLRITPSAVLMLDCDKAGVLATEKILSKLKDTTEKPIYVMKYSQKDPFQYQEETKALTYKSWLKDGSGVFNKSKDGINYVYLDKESMKEVE